jgi:hypothetical protein
MKDTMTPTAKDFARIRGILTRTPVGPMAARKRASLMAAAITTPDKAYRRAAAADAGGAKDIARIFWIRYGRLTA